MGEPISGSSAVRNNRSNEVSPLITNIFCLYFLLSFFVFSSFFIVFSLHLRLYLWVNLFQGAVRCAITDLMRSPPLITNIYLPTAQDISRKLLAHRCIFLNTLNAYFHLQYISTNSRGSEDDDRWKFEGKVASFREK